MADTPISGLNRTTTLDTTDLLVLEQSGQAKAITAASLLRNLTENWGEHGGIVSIAKTGTSGLVDTYTITYADETTSTYTVTNGLGISNMTSRTVWALGRADTAIDITYSDGSTQTFTVRGGEKGDTGDNAYVHIKYSALQPTSDAEMHDYADAWMGVCSNSSSTAPTTYSMYTWYNIKGAKGDTGDTGAPGADGAPGEAGARAWMSSSAPTNAGGVYVFTPSQISTPTGITATPQVGDMIWWTNNYYFITNITYSGGQVNAYGCNNTYAIFPGNYVNNVYYAEYGVTATGALEDAWAAGKAIFCVMPQAQQDDPQNILTLSCVYDTGHGYNGYIFSAVHHDSDTYLEVAQCGQSAINSWSTATYSLSGGGGGSDELFIATVGTTTKAQIDASITAGKFVVAYWATGGINNEPCYYSLSEVLQSNSGYVFSMFDGTHLHYVTVDSTDSWDGDTVGVPTPQTSGTPAALGTAARGTATTYSRSDHVHAKPSASDIGAVAVAQGVAHAGEFVVVGSDGNITTVTMTAWSGGNY